ncbi:MAG: iduronate-2-sulfatase [Lentisphaerae bacterium RIFOXYA12_FULL_48_11]|nr:MAG: iduronate-2-sulfatase [Lentisphaerae bacterium RIFOXYA12_FULL_48_11]
MLVCIAAMSASAAQRPNVLFLVSDDLNNFLGAYGDPRAKTPNIDRLAARGVRFEHSYCAFPLCGPSRNSFLTGLYPNSSGILNNAQIFRQTIPSHVSLPQAFRQAGYFAGRIGKLYHYGVPKSIGTNGHDDPGSWELELNPAGVDRLEEEPHIFTLTPGQFGGTLSWYASPKSDEYHTDGMLAADAEWVLERCARQKDRPFFLAVGFYRPHTPYVAPKKPYFGWYDEDRMPLVTGVQEDQTDLPAAALGSYKKEQDKLTDQLRRQCVQAYYASISFMDAQVGRVVSALDRLGLAESTIIVFTSDHGYHMGEHGLWQKMSLFEESTRVPMLIVAPGITKPGTVAGAPVSQIDIYPTLAELAGIKVPANLQGQSLVPILKDVSVTGRNWALTQVSRGGGAKRFFGYSLRTPRWRYTEWNEGQAGRELYDHDADKKEINNLAEKAEHAATVADLSKQLRAAVQATFPPGGKTPELRDGLWAPNLTDP